jgi:hypothetical protein
MDIDQLRDSTTDVMGSVADQASRVAADLADRVSGPVGTAAEGVGQGLAKAKDAVASLSVEPPRSRRRWPWLIAAVAALIGLTLVVRAVRARAARDHTSSGGEDETVHDLDGRSRAARPVAHSSA